jgi:hypothetical protein
MFLHRSRQRISGSGRVRFVLILQFKLLNLQKYGLFQVSQGWVFLIEILDLLKPLQGAAESFHLSGMPNRGSSRAPSARFAEVDSHAIIVTRLWGDLNATVEEPLAPQSWEGHPGSRGPEAGLSGDLDTPVMRVHTGDLPSSRAKTGVSPVKRAGRHWTLDRWRRFPAIYVGRCDFI